MRKDSKMHVIHGSCFANLRAGMKNAPMLALLAAGMSVCMNFAQPKIAVVKTHPDDRRMHASHGNGGVHQETGLIMTSAVEWSHAIFACLLIMRFVWRTALKRGGKKMTPPVRRARFGAENIATYNDVGDTCEMVTYNDVINACERGSPS